MFEELSGGPLPNGRQPDIRIAIFPHLREFIVIDTRRQPAEVIRMATDDVFDGDYYREVEREFAGALREGQAHPFLHLMHLPNQVDEIVRGVAMNRIMARLGVDFHREEELPEVVVFVISGPPLALPVEQLVSDFAAMLSERLGAAELARWQRELGELIEAETEAFAQTHEVLGESLTEEALDPYYIWQNRN